MSNLVDVNEIEKRIYNLNETQQKPLSMDRRDGLAIIESTSTISFKNYGRWIVHEYDFEAECSNCGRYVGTSYARVSYDFKYCSYCGSHNSTIEED